jgi:hypothetical protein
LIRRCHFWWICEFSDLPVLPITTPTRRSIRSTRPLSDAFRLFTVLISLLMDPRNFGPPLHPFSRPIHRETTTFTLFYINFSPYDHPCSGRLRRVISVQNYNNEKNYNNWKNYISDRITYLTELQIWQNYKSDRITISGDRRARTVRTRTSKDYGQVSGDSFIRDNLKPRDKFAFVYALNLFPFTRSIIHFCSLSWKITVKIYDSQEFTKRWSRSRFLGCDPNFC